MRFIHTQHLFYNLFQLSRAAHQVDCVAQPLLRLARYVLHKPRLLAPMPHFVHLSFPLIIVEQGTNLPVCMMVVLHA